MSVEAESVTTNVRLPPDVWQLLFDELASRYVIYSTALSLALVTAEWHCIVLNNADRLIRGDFASLYSCAVTSKYLAGSGALANLYR